MDSNPSEDHLLFDRDMLEGNWTTYAHLWQRALTGGGGGLRWTVSIDVLRNLFYQCWRDGNPNDRFGVYTLNTGVPTFESVALVNYINNLTYIDTFAFVSNCSNRFNASTHARYIAITRLDGFNIEIWKDGALLVNLNLQAFEVGALVQGIAMSQDGRYILILSDLGTVHCWQAV